MIDKKNHLCCNVARTQNLLSPTLRLSVLALIKNCVDRSKKRFIEIFFIILSLPVPALRMLKRLSLWLHSGHKEN